MADIDTRRCARALTLPGPSREIIVVPEPVTQPVIPPPVPSKPKPEREPAPTKAPA